MTSDEAEGKDRQDHDLRQLGAAAAELSHELRNLLVVVLAHAELLIEGKAEDPVVLAENIQRAAISCKDLVDDVLTWAGRRRTPETSIDLVPIFEHLARLQATSPGLVLTNPQQLKEAWIKGRAGDLERVVLNLVRNAEAAQPKGRIELRLSAEAGYFQLQVNDDGPGIPAAVREKIFEPFYSATKTGGTGLGLAIARRVAEEHGGTLTVTESEWHGASFVLRLPKDQTGAGSAKVAATADSSALVRSLKVLCVDDDESTLETYQMILKLEGHESSCAANAREALQHVRTSTFDALLVDLRLPDMRAPELLSELRRLRPELVGRVIFATGDLMNDASRKFLDAMGNPYLAKPFRIEQLRLALELVARRP